MLSVAASRHQGHAMYRGAGRQCAANSMLAMVGAKHKTPSKWTTDDMDIVLQKGDDLYMSLSSNQKYLLIADLPKNIHNFELAITNTYSGTINRKSSDRPFMCLHDSLKDLEQFCFLTVGCYTIALIQEENIYYVFDSHSRNDCGMSVPSGTAVLTQLHSLHELCLFIQHLCASLFVEKVDKPFEATHVTLCSSSEIWEQIIESSLSESDFSGYSKHCAFSDDVVSGANDQHNVMQTSDLSASSEDMPLADLRKKLCDFESDSDISCYSSGSEYKPDKREKEILENDISESDSSAYEDDCKMRTKSKKSHYQTWIDGARHRDSFGIHDSLGKNSRDFREGTGGHGKSSGGHGKSSGGHGKSSGGHAKSNGGHGKSNGGHEKKTGGHGKSNGGHGKCNGGHKKSAEGNGKSVGGHGKSNGKQEERTGEHGKCTGERKESTGEQEQSTGEQEESNGEQEESIGEQEEGTGEQEQSTQEQEESNGEQEESIGEQEESTGEQEESFGGQEERTREQQERHGEQEECAGGQEERSPEQQERSREQEERTQEQQERSGEQEESTGGQGENIGDQGENCGGRKSRKRTRDEQNWKENLRKRKKNSGQPHTNTTGRFCRARQIGKGCGQSCRFKCHQNVTNEQRSDIFHLYWSLGDLNMQRQFLLKYAKSDKKKSMTSIRNTSRRSNSTKWTLPVSNTPIKVCKTFFLQTLDISSQMVKTANVKSLDIGICALDKRGKHQNRKHAISNESKNLVKTHIQSFPCVESHYCRRDSRKQYLSTDLTLSRMYSLYCEKCSRQGVMPVKFSMYRHIFDHEFNLAFHRPKKDLCDFCSAFRVGSIDFKQNNKEKFQKHMQNKNLARENKERDKNLAKLGNNNLVVACFDLEEVLTTPKAFESIQYYKRKLNTFNFTVYDLGTSDGHCFIWNETIGRRGACEISSCVFDFINNLAKQGKTKFVFYSDNCWAQNKNRFYISMLWYVFNKLNLESIEHRYLEKGHTQNEGDSIHAAVENASRNISVYTTGQWASIVRAARPRKPYIVKEMSQRSIYNFKEVSKYLKNFELDSNGDRIHFPEIKTLRFDSSTPNIMYFRYNYQEEEHKIKLTHLRRSQTNVTVHEIDLEKLYDRPIPLTLQKYMDLVCLCRTGVIPDVYHALYALLPHE